MGYMCLHVRTAVMGYMRLHVRTAVNGFLQNPQVATLEHVVTSSDYQMKSRVHKFLSFSILH
jgi:hypothetical protein